MSVKLTTAHHIQNGVSQACLAILRQCFGQPEDSIIFCSIMSKPALAQFVGEFSQGFFCTFVFVFGFFFFVLLGCAHYIFKCCSSVAKVAFIIICLAHNQIQIILPSTSGVMYMNTHTSLSYKRI